LEQQGVDLDLIVSIDASGDGTEQWLNDLARQREQLVILPSGRRFGGAAANFFRLLTEADFTGFDYVALSDQDDIWLPGKLARAVEVVRSNGADAYSSNVIAFWPDGRRALVNKAQAQRRWDHLFEAAGPGCTYVLSIALVLHVRRVLLERASAVRRIGLHDWFLYAFARANGYRWQIDDQPGLLYRQHGRNEVGVNVGFTALLKRARRVANGWAFAQARLIAELVGAEDEELVRRGLAGGRVGAVWLALQVGECRRRPRDRIFFVLACLLRALGIDMLR
jgi:rhamnosyltransferase